MFRAVIALMCGLLSAAIITSVVSVFLLHDVDRGQSGNLRLAFLSLCVEAAVFALIVGILTGLLTMVANSLLHFSGLVPQLTLVYWLGVGVALLQYVWDLAARKFLPPSYADWSLGIYMLAASIVCSTVLLKTSTTARL